MADTPSIWLVLLSGGTGAALWAFGERVVKMVGDFSLERRRELAERRKLVLEATLALTTAKQNSGKDYFAGDVSELFTRLMYLMEHDGAPWDKAKFHAEFHGHNASEILQEMVEKKLPPQKT
jgi:hypothetical protein